MIVLTKSKLFDMLAVLLKSSLSFILDVHLCAKSKNA